MMGFKSIGRALAALMLMAVLAFGTHGFAIAQDIGTPIVADASVTDTPDVVTTVPTDGDTTDVSNATETNTPEAVATVAPVATETSTVEAAASDTPEVTQVAAPDANVTVASDASPSATPDASATVAADVSATISFYDCTSDPGDASPSGVSGCTVAQGVRVSVSVDGVDSGSFTSDGSGLVTVNAPAGSAVVVTEDQSTIASGFSPYGDGSLSFTATEGVSRTFVHLMATDLGRVQIVSGTCPTSGTPGTAFRVVEPGLARAAAEQSCGKTPNISFTISGGGLASGLVVSTDSGGNWRGFLPSGDYTITSSDSVSAGFTVYNQDIVAIVAIDYLGQPTGAFTIDRWQCASVAIASATIKVAAAQPANPTGCSASNGNVSLTEVGGSAAPAEFTLGAGGSINVNLKPGSYVLTDEASGETASFQIGANEALFATISSGPPADSGGGAGSGADGNGSGNSSDGSGSGNGSGVDVGNGTGESNGAGSSSDGTGAVNDSTDASRASATSGSAAVTTNGAVTALPNTGVRPSQPNNAFPISAALILLSVVVIAAAVFRRRTKT